MVLAYIPNPPCRPGGVILHVVSVPLLVLDFRVSDPIMLLSCRSQKVRDSLFPLSDLRAYEKLEFPDNQEQAHHTGAYNCTQERWTGARAESAHASDSVSE